MLEIKQKQIQL